VGFRVGQLADTGLPDGCADVVLSVDALCFAPDRAAALSELRRIEHADQLRDEVGHRLTDLLIAEAEQGPSVFDRQKLLLVARAPR
jgi:hypothetical protein